MNIIQKIVFNHQNMTRTDDFMNQNLTKPTRKLWDDFPAAISPIDEKTCNNKVSTLVTTFQKPELEENPYVRVI